MLRARTHTHKLQRGFLHVFDTVGLGCNMKDRLTPLQPCKTYQMAQNGGPFWLPCSVGVFFIGETLSKDQPIIILISNTLLSLIMLPQPFSYTHMLRWNHLLQQHMGLREEVGGQRENALEWGGSCFCWVIVFLNRCFK